MTPHPPISGHDQPSSDHPPPPIAMSALFDLHGKSALVTGASRGIGLAIAEILAGAGARVLISSEDPIACAEVAARLRHDGLDVHAQGCDVADPDALRALAARARADGGGAVDVLVCNAGIAGPQGPLAAVSDDDWEQVMTINLRSALRLSNLLIPDMVARGGGSVIVTASLAALRGNKAIGLYGISKAGLLQLVRNLAVEWGPSNVRANAICPGVIRTDFARPIVDDQTIGQRRQQLTPLRRFGVPAEVAGVALLLASAAGAFITGQSIVVDGGTSIGDGN